jgi:hypothetical protein
MKMEIVDSRKQLTQRAWVKSKHGEKDYTQHRISDREKAVLTKVRLREVKQGVVTREVTDTKTVVV